VEWHPLSLSSLSLLYYEANTGQGVTYVTASQNQWSAVDGKGGETNVNQLMTVKEAAETLAVTEAAIRKWLYQRRLPCVKVGRATRLRRQDVEAVVTQGLHPDRRAGR
jgi:excisionase family DNA binding protein